MFVISTKTGNKYDYVEFNPLKPEQYNKMFRENVPNMPFDDPIVDPLACWLFENSSILQRLLHHITKYDCVDPMFIEGKRIYPTTFLYEKEMIKFRDNVLDPEFREGFLENWKKNVGLAIAKLSGHFYTSAGAD